MHCDLRLIRTLMARVRRCALARMLLFCSNGFRAYVRALVQRTLTLQQGLYLIGTAYNFCTPHANLRSAAQSVGTGRIARTPAMVAGITDHYWTMHELWSFHVPPRWTPPKRRGRHLQALQLTIERWCHDHG